MTIKDLFDKHDDEYLKFDRVVNKLSTRPDVHAFILLDKLISSTADMVCGAEHDVIYLDVVIEELAEIVTEEQIVELARCGVHYDSETDSLAMWT